MRRFRLWFSGLFKKETPSEDSLKFANAMKWWAASGGISNDYNKRG